MLLWPLGLRASESDSTALRQAAGRWGGGLRFFPGRQLPLDSYSRQWIHGKQTFTVAAELTHVSLPQDSDAYAADYGWPTMGVGVSYDFNHATTMHRYPSPSWGKAQEVDYMSVMGNALTVYGSFSRSLVRSRQWELAYVLRCGIGFYSHRYNNRDAIDNELIGSFANIYFGAALTASWHFSPEWALMGGLEYRHHSNGALARPNKGENAVGPVVGVVYSPACRNIADGYGRSMGGGLNHRDFSKFWFVDFALGVGGKTLLEDWQLTQFHTDPGEPDYRTEHFDFHPAYSFQTSFMRRYSRRWATGLCADLFYGSYFKRIRDLENNGGHPEEAARVSPWSVGVGLKHEVHYQRVTLAMSLGAYLFRRMGSSAKVIEKPYYERIGVRYSFPSLGGLFVGAGVNAHLTKADFTELVVGFPIRVH